jgi:hypothetical protein
MFRPDPHGGHSVEQVIAKLSDILEDLPHDSPRAQTLGKMIRGLEKIKNERRVEKNMSEIS